jgi:hypothetical protein
MADAGNKWPAKDLASDAGFSDVPAIFPRKEAEGVR